MWIARLKIALFVAFLLAPVVALLSLGAVERYGRAQTEFPPVGQVLLGKKGRFEQFGDAVLERSIVRRAAIQMQSLVSYRLVGFVDNERLVSGNGDWLFYRPEFNNGACLDEEQAATRLRTLAAVLDVGRAAGIDMVMSMSPDKSTIYPEELSATMRGYWKCRIENGKTLRRLIKRELPELIDHAEALFAEKERHPDIPLYFVTDTHWTPYGGAIALQQLLAAIHPDARIPAARLSTASMTTRTDLARMLLLSIEEHGPRAEPLLARDIALAVGDRPAVKTLIIHDSFYAQIRREILDAFPEKTTMLVFESGDRLLTEGLSAGRLIINAIERRFVTVGGDLLGWKEDIPIAILNRNMQRAQDCRAFDAAVSPGAGVAPILRDVAVRTLAPGHLPCLRLSVTARKRAMLEVALPNPATGAFESGRALKYRVEPGTRTVVFVLPGYTAGSGIQVSFDRADRITAISSIEVGELLDIRSDRSITGVSDQP